MLRLIPPGSPNKSPAGSLDSLSPEVLSATHFKRNSLLNIGFQGNHEDNLGRKKKVKQFFEDFNKKLEVLRKNGVPVTIKQKIKDNSAPLYAILDGIFSLYNINIHIITQDQSDSAIRIEPNLHMGKAVQCLVSVAVVLSKFPYSFIKLIDLNKFTVCKRAQLKKGNYEELYASRILTNAMFMLDVHDTHEKIENFFYKVVLFHAKKKVPEIHTEWPIERSPRQESSRTVKVQFYTFNNNSPLPSPRLSSPRTKSPSPIKDEQTRTAYDEIKEKEELEVFAKILADPKLAFDSNNPRLQMRAKFLKEQLEVLDSIGICKEWWEDISKGTATIVEDAKEFSIKF